MNNKTDFFVSTAVSLVLSLSVLWCLASSFSISVSPFITVTASLIFTGYFALLSQYVKVKSKLLICYLVTAVVLVFTVLFSLEILLSQINYSVNCVLKIYSQYLSFPSTVYFSPINSENADYLFVVLSFLLCSVITDSLVRMKRTIPVVIISVVFLIPCFIIVNTLPSLVPLVTVVSLLFSLYATSFIHKKNPAQGGAVMLGSTAVLLIVSIILCFIFPVENYKRYGWQDSLLEFAQNITGHKASDGNSDTDTNGLALVRNSVDESEDLSQLGKLEQDGKKVMRVFAQNGGTIYLKGISYANYSNNEWSLMTDEQEDSIPKSFNAFTMTEDVSDKASTLSIITENKEKFAFLPYFTREIPKSFTAISDVLVNNNYGYISYDVKYSPYSESGEYYSTSTESFNDYLDFVYDTYTDIPQETADKLIEIGEESGINPPRYGESSSQNTYRTNEEYAKLVKDLVSSHGYYSLDTERMPEGEDFPVWFLTQSESGYCVHYAATAALMLRAYGVPSRYVTGYYASVRSGEWTVISSDNAHAWTEYFDDERGWIPLEATPASFEPAQYISSVEPDSTSDYTQPTTETATKITEAETTMPETVTTADDNKNNNSNKESTDFGVLNIVLTTLLLLFAAAACVFIRRAILLSLRKKHFSSGKSNRRAVYIYRHIEALGRFSNNIIPDEIQEIAMKARFSNHTICAQELKTLAGYCSDAENELLYNSSALKRIYLKYILVIV